MPNDDEEFDEVAFKRLKREADAELARLDERRVREYVRLSELLARDELRTASAPTRKGVIEPLLPSTLDALDAVSPERHAALERVHGMMCALIDVADVLADRAVSEEDAAEAVRLVGDVQEKLWGRTLEMIAAMSLVDRIARYARAVADGKALDDAVLEVISGMTYAGFPEVTDALRDAVEARAAIGAAIRDWAEGTGHWKPVARAVALAGLGERDPGSLRQQWAKWRHDPVRPPVIL